MEPLGAEWPLARPTPPFSSAMRGRRRIPTDVIGTWPGSRGLALTASSIRRSSAVRSTADGLPSRARLPPAACAWPTPKRGLSLTSPCFPNSLSPTSWNDLASLHLTDFAAASVPAIPVLRPSELVALRPRDLATKLRVLLIVCFGLFGLMNILAAAVSVHDARDRARRFRQLCAKFGHVTHPCGAWCACGRFLLRRSSSGRALLRGVALPSA